jgi:hypothetical protein
MNPGDIRTETDFFPFQGGLDKATAALHMPAGMVLACLNYEPDQNGGYTRMKGYERFDGRPAPSSVTTDTGGTAAQVSQALVDAAQLLRPAISAPPGSGPIRGLAYYGNALYAFRDNAGGTAGAMWKSTATGWQAITLCEEVTFTNANVSVGDGDTLTQGGVTSAILRVVLQTGSLASGVNTGRLIINGRLGGNYTAAAATTTGGGTLTVVGAQTATTISAGGRYQFDQYNFGGATATIKLYGCNGIDRGFEFDGTTFVPISTGAAIDAPAYVNAHRKYLYWAKGSSVTNSSIADPYRYVAAEGAIENAVGDTVTGMASLPGQAMAIVCRNSSFVLSGSSTADWVVNTLRADVGAVPYTLAVMSDTFMLDDRGIVSIKTAQEYGNFADATLSRKIQPLVDRIRTKVVGGYISRQKGHYVLLMNDGTTLTTGINNGQLVGFMEGKLGFTPSCVWSGEDESGIERIFIGGTDGMVYEMDKGSTFDGADIESYVKIYYYNSKTPRIKKRYRRLVLEMVANLYAGIRFKGELSYGDPSIGQTESTDVAVTGSGGSWDFASWDEFFWDAQDISQPDISLTGVGVNLALSFYSSTKLDFGHTLQGAVLHYSLRRQQR